VSRGPQLASDTPMAANREESAEGGPVPARATAERPAPRIVPVRHPGRWVATVVCLLVAIDVAYAMSTNPAFEWHVVGQYLTRNIILTGVLRTLELTGLSMVIGISFGVVVALMRLSPNLILANAGRLYIWFFRGTPVLVQLIFWYNLAALYSTITLGVPFGPSVQLGHVNTVITPFVAALLGLGLNEAAYMAEIVRAGIISVEKGQSEAAAALGLTRMLTMRRIVLPQAMRVIIPPTGNEAIGMLKATSLVSVISLPELLYSAQIVYNRTFQTIPLLIVASVWYLIATSLLSVIQSFVERHYGRGSGDAAPRRVQDLLFRFR
jgi:polar amino acid transport system permease protein